jgi:hypothetical protein
MPALLHVDVERQYHHFFCEIGNRMGEVRMKRKPRANNSHFGAKKVFFEGAVDAGFPLQYSDFPHRRALSSAG